MLDKLYNKVYNKNYNRVKMPKYDSLRKTTRNKALIEYANNHPDLSMKEIGEVFGISSPRVWIILNSQRRQKVG